MKTTALRGWAALIVLATGCATSAPSAPRPPVPGAAPEVRVLVTIVVDQLAAWIAEQRWPELPADGGFARLRREGLYVRELRYDHAVTDTAPGHSALYTGAVPRVSGIVGNDVPRESGGDPLSILADAHSRLLVVGAAQPLNEPGASLAPLAVETLADVLAKHDPDAAIFSFSLKDRGALFGAGRHPTLALWFEPAQEAFVSSTAFVPTIPDWVAPLGGRDAVRAARSQAWELLDPSWIAAHALTPDAQPGEGDYAGLGRTFPHAIPSAKAMRATPAGDLLLLDLARGALAHIAPAPHRTLLAISFSSNDYVGHMFGPDSWEAWDELRRLDRRIAELLAALDSAVGPDRYAVVLSGDHGIGALPELEGAARQAACRRTAVPGLDRDAPPGACTRGQRLLSSDVIEVLEKAWQHELGGDPGARDPGVRLINTMLDSSIYLSSRGRALAPADRARLVRVASAVLHDRFNVTEVVDIRGATAPCAPSADQSRAALVCRSVRPDGLADFYLVVEPRTFFDAHYTPGAGANHGSPYLYDRAVPLLVRAPGRIPQGKIREEPVRFTAFVRTAASLLNIPLPDGAGDGEDLTTTTATTTATKTAR